MAFRSGLRDASRERGRRLLSFVIEVEARVVRQEKFPGAVERELRDPDAHGVGREFERLDTLGAVERHPAAASLSLSSVALDRHVAGLERGRGRGVALPPRELLAELLVVLVREVRPLDAEAREEFEVFPVAPRGREAQVHELLRRLGVELVVPASRTDVEQDDARNPATFRRKRASRLVEISAPRLGTARARTR